NFNTRLLAILGSLLVAAIVLFVLLRPMFESAATQPTATPTPVVTLVRETAAPALTVVRETAAPVPTQPPPPTQPPRVVEVTAPPAPTQPPPTQAAPT